MTTTNAATEAPEELAPSTEQQATEAPEELAPSTEAAEEQAGSAPAESAQGEPSEKVQQEINRVVRKRYEAEREAAELRQRLEEMEAQQRGTVVDPGDMPTLESCDYDDGKLSQEMAAWATRKAQAEAQSIVRQSAEAASQAEMAAALRKQEAEYSVKAEAFAQKTPGYDQSFNNLLSVVGSGSPVARAILAAENSPQIIHHLGQNLDKASTLASLPAEAVAVQIGRLDATLAAPPQKQQSGTPTPPEQSLSGSGAELTDDFDKDFPNAQFV